MKHFEQTLATCFCNTCNIYNILIYFCNIPIYFCNIHVKHLQHTSETSETLETYACNMSGAALLWMAITMSSALRNSITVSIGRSGLGDAGAKSTMDCWLPHVMGSMQNWSLWCLSTYHSSFSRVPSALFFLCFLFAAALACLAAGQLCLKTNQYRHEFKKNNAITGQYFNKIRR
jgi:hypothetical protein